MEAMRRDFINTDVAPNMSGFAEQHIAPKQAFSSANSTHTSWFAIFHSCYPYHWTEVRDSWKQGSIPLQILKKMGYRIRVYSGADVAYFNMDKIVLGENRQLADSVKDYAHLRNIEPSERDRLAIEALTEDANKEQEGTVFITFLDSTHSEYSTPDDFPHPFQPAAASVDYLAISTSSQDLEQLKNRYRNSIHWVDHLVGGFFQKLKELKPMTMRSSF
jgi:membrane-anchored protein YejM (alkaline phosphatase superfamily)